MSMTPDEHPRLNASERSTYRALIDQLEPNDLVVPGQRVTDHLKDHEVDFVVAIEGAGIVCIEVKGGEVWHDGEVGARSAAAASTRSSRSAKPAKPAMPCAISSRKTRAGPRIGCAGTTSSCCRTPSYPPTSGYQTVRGGR